MIEAALNGKSVGRTATMKDFETNKTNDKLFIRNSANALLHFAVPFGHDLTFCTMDLFVLSKPHPQASEKKDGRNAKQTSKDKGREVASKISEFSLLAAVSVSGAVWLPIVEAAQTSGNEIHMSHFTPLSLPMSAPPSHSTSSGTVRGNSSGEMNILAVLVSEASPSIRPHSVLKKVSVEEVRPVLSSREMLDLVISDASLTEAGMKQLKSFAPAATSSVPIDGSSSIPAAHNQSPVMMVVKWNNQEVRRFFGVMKSYNKVQWSLSEASLPSSKVQIRVRLPGNYSLDDCRLDIQLFVQFRSEALDEMTLTDAAFYGYQSDGTDSSSLQFVQLSKKMVRFHFGYSVVPSSSSLLMNQLKKAADHRRYKPCTKLTRIASPLEEDMSPWRALFATPLAARMMELGRLSSKPSERDKKLRAMNLNSTILLDDDSADLVGSKDKLLPLRVELHRQKQLELAAMSFVSTARAQGEDECRAIWRGRLLPRHFVGSTVSVMKAVMQARSSRLIRTKNISELKILAEVHHLKDAGEDGEQMSPQLPICIKEVCSQGPGVITVKLRVEVFANNGVLLGLESRFFFSLCYIITFFLLGLLNSMTQRKRFAR